MIYLYIYVNYIYAYWGLTPLSTIFQLYRSGGGNRGTRRKPPTCRKSPTNFITPLDYVYNGADRLFYLPVFLPVINMHIRLS